METNNADIEQNPPNKNPEPNANVEGVKNFLKTKLLSIIKKIIAEPIGGSYQIFATPDKNKKSNAISLLGIGFIFTYLIFAIALTVQGYGGAGSGMILKISLVLIITLLLIAVFSLVVKAIGGAKISFGDELLTGGICVIPLCLFLLILFIMSLFTSSSSYGLMGRDFSDFIAGGSVIMLASIIYLFLYLVTIVQQSLKASKVNDALSWYLSPLIIVLSFYIGGKIGVAMLY